MIGLLSVCREGGTDLIGLLSVCREGGAELLSVCREGGRGSPDSHYLSVWEGGADLIGNT